LKKWRTIKVTERETTPTMQERAKRLALDPLNLCSVGTVRRLLLEHRIRPSKALGQSFLVSRSALAVIVETAALQPSDGVLEVGTGLGTLTAALAQRCRRTVSLEKDRRLFAIAVQQLAAFPNVVVYHADALVAQWRDLLERNADGVVRWKFVSNLPYAVSKPLLMRLLRERHLFADATVTVQREVAQRLVAKPGQSNYSVLSVAFQLYGEAHLAATLPPTSFFPPPEVWSTVVHIRFLPVPRVPVADERFFFRVAEAALMQRRKTLANALSGGLRLPKDRITAVLRSCGIEPERRGETLTLVELARLADALKGDMEGLPYA
jgi:16S rRNA (adenine1518-N6/adenine1519-N6)-dimethyltransferase